VGIIGSLALIVVGIVCLKSEHGQFVLISLFGGNS
jgi:hypothetical protein